MTLSDLSKKISFKWKLILGLAAILAMFIFLGVKQFNSINTIDDLREDISVSLKLKENLSELKFILADEMHLFDRLKISGTMQDFSSNLKHYQEIDYKLGKKLNSIYHFLENENWDKSLQFLKTNSLKCLEAVQFSHEIKIKPIFQRLKMYHPLLSNNENGSFVNANDLNSEIKVLDAEFYTIINEHFKKLNSLEESISKIENDYEKIAASISRSSGLQLLITFLIAIIVSLLLIFRLTSIITKPIRKIKDSLVLLSKGIFPEINKVSGNDEIGEIEKSLNNLVESLKETKNFADELGAGNLQKDFKLTDKDVLAQSLIKMQESLKKSSIEEEKRKADEYKRNWATEGQAKFGEILRQNNDNIEKLGDEIISNLVHYLNANQGGLFLYNDDNPEDIYLEMVSCYAYNRKKFTEERYKLKEGLIGTCAIEKETIYITEIPDDYIRITSGLGDGNPRSLILVPLKLEEEIFGIIELASFNELEPHEIAFLEKIGDSIARTLSAVKTNIKTQDLLSQTQKQAAMLVEQEEEMRQNMEEMKATQEDLNKAMNEAKKSVDNLNNLPNPVLTVDTDFVVNYINPAGARIAGLSVEQCIGKRCYELFKNPHCQTDNCRCKMAMKFDSVHVGETVVSPNGKDIPIEYTGAPIHDINGNIIGALEIVVDLTDRKKQEEALKQQTEELVAQEEELRQNMEEMKATQDELNKAMNEAKKSVDNLNNLPNPVLTVDTDFVVNYINPAGAKVAGLSVEQCLGKKCYELFKNPHCQTDNCKCKMAMKSDSINVGETVVSPQGIDIPIEYTGAPIHDIDGNIIGALEIVVDLTERKKQEDKIKLFAEELSKKDILQKHEIERLNQENNQKIEEMKAMQEKIIEDAEKSKERDKELIKQAKMESQEQIMSMEEMLFKIKKERKKEIAELNGVIEKLNNELKKFNK